MLILKFIKNSFLVFITSLVIFIAAAYWDELNLIFLVFSPLYVPLGAVILTIIEHNFRPGKLATIILTIIITIIAFFISMAFIYSIN